MSTSTPEPPDDTLDIDLEPAPEEAPPEPATEQPEPDPPSEESVEPDRDLTSAEQRNELLTAEIEELRSILDGVEGNDPAPTVGSAPDEEQPVLDPPTPPRRPPNRTGAAGNVVEFAEMLVYLARSAWYRIRVRYHYR